MHFVTLFWKLLFALIPPTGKKTIPGYLIILILILKFILILILILIIFNSLLPLIDIAGGYLSFFVSIVVIGIVTAIIGDVASLFGCTLGIKDSVTAICFVSLGTSIPGK